MDVTNTIDEALGEVIFANEFDWGIPQIGWNNYISLARPVNVTHDNLMLFFIIMIHEIINEIELDIRVI